MEEGSVWSDSTLKPIFNHMKGFLITCICCWPTCPSRSTSHDLVLKQCNAGNHIVMGIVYEPLSKPWKQIIQIQGIWQLWKEYELLLLAVELLDWTGDVNTVCYLTIDHMVCYSSLGNALMFLCKTLMYICNSPFKWCNWLSSRNLWW